MKQASVTRRQAIKQAGLLLAACSLPCSPAVSIQRASQQNSGHMLYKGISYDTGTNFDPQILSVEWRTDAMQYDIKAIKDALHCNAITVFGTDIERLKTAAAFALENGLHTWIQPRLFHSSQEKMLAHLAAAAAEAEQLRKQHQQVVLNIGCEWSLFVSGIIPGHDLESRIQSLSNNWQSIPAYNKKLNALLKEACQTASAVFKGQLTYSAGNWEEVDWKRFDIIGLNYYLDEDNEAGYTQHLRTFKKYGKPVVITEFGCCCYEGAEKKGGGGHDIIDWTGTVPKIKGHYTRNEAVQASYLTRLLNIYQQEGIDGAFVYVFSDLSQPWSPDPLYDLDMANYGIVKALHDVTLQTPVAQRWEPKAGFNAIAKAYGLP